MPALLRALCLSAALAAQNAPAPPAQSPQGFKSSVDIVRVDVNAIDANGRPVRDLAAADFALTVDGKPRPIVTAQFVSVPAAAPRSEAPRPVHYSSNAESSGGRLIMVVVDRMSILPGRGRAAIDAASRFVTRLNRADRVALASLPNGPQVGFTANHELVEQRLQTIDGMAFPNFGRYRLAVRDALAFERRDTTEMEAVIGRECASVDGRGGGGSEALYCRNEIRSEASRMAADIRNRARNAINGLQALIEGLPPSETPKIIIFISEGLVIEREAEQLAWLEARAAAAHVTIYPLHLEASEFDASLDKPAPRLAEDRATREQGLATLAMATGGDMFRIIANSEFAFDRLANELSGYYLLGFEPAANERNGQPHTIRVDVRRPGVTVRSRRQFTATESAPATPEREIVAALRDPLPAADIPIELTTYSLLEDGGKVRVLVAANVDRSINPDGQMSIGYVLVDFDGKTVDTAFNVPLDPSTSMSSRTGLFFKALTIAPGKYSLKLAVVDDARRRGTVERVTDARVNVAGPLRAGDLVLTDGRVSAGGSAAPTVSGRIRSGWMHAYLEIAADRPATLNQASVTLEIAPAIDGKAIDRVSVPLGASADLDGGRVAGVNVNVERLAPGDYVARAVLAVGLNGVGQVVRPFTIDPAAR